MTLVNYITVNPLPVAVFSAADTMVYIPGGNAVFANTSTDATSYVWNFGDGQSSTDFQPWHSFASQGDYSVTLVAHNALCGNDTLTLTDYIHVVDVTGISQLGNSAFTVTLSPNPSDGIINLNIKGIQDKLNLKIFNIEGQLIYSSVINGDAYSYSDVINLNDYGKGIYYLELRNKDILKVEKIVLY
jgi:PKD repeat protein